MTAIHHTQQFNQLIWSSNVKRFNVFSKLTIIKLFWYDPNKSLGSLHSEIKENGNFQNVLGLVYIQMKVNGLWGVKIERPPRLLEVAGLIPGQVIANMLTHC